MKDFDPQVLQRLTPDEIPTHLAELHPGMSLTRGSHKSLVPGYVNDLEWNFFDELHRYHVHNTYHGMYKVMTGREFSVNVVRWGNLPIFIQVANAKVANGLFYQSMTVLGIIMLHQVIRFNQKEEGQVLIEVDWHTASHWIFRWLHRPFNKRLLKLQVQQDEEDNRIIRHQRRDLRRRGMTFKTDDPDFINSNRLTDNVILPTLSSPLQIPIEHLVEGRAERVVSGPIELLLRKTTDGIHVWPALCPHEGADMYEHSLCDGEVVCPWHGRKFRGAILRPGDGQVFRYLSVAIRCHGTFLEVEQVDEI